MFPSIIADMVFKLTTEVLSPDHRGSCKEPHLLVGSLQAGMRSCTSSGSVATFTSDRALAQAEELTSHMKENTTVTTKSWGKQRRTQFQQIHRTKRTFFFFSFVRKNLFSMVRSLITADIRCEEITSKSLSYSQWAAFDCFRGTYSGRKCKQQWPRENTGRRKQQWWRRTQQRKNNLRWGTHALSSWPHTWVLRTTLGATCRTQRDVVLHYHPWILKYSVLALRKYRDSKQRSTLSNSPHE